MLLYEHGGELYVQKGSNFTYYESTYKNLIIVAGRRTEEARMVIRAKFILGSLKYSSISWHFSYDKYNP
jgi:hypothetical protein